MPDISSLYPHPPSNNNALLSDPAKVIDMATSAKKLQILDDQSDALSQIPQAQLEGQRITNSTALMQQQAEAYRHAATVISGMIPDRAKPDDVHNAVTNFSRMHPETILKYPGMANGVSDIVLNHPRGISAGVAALRNSALSPAEASAPTDVGVTPTGQTVTGTRAQFNTSAAGGGVVTQPPPGFKERQTGGADIDTRMSGALGEAAEGSPGRRAILGNLEDALGNFTTGPGADWTNVAKSFVNRNVPLPQGWNFDPKSIASQEEFNKQAAQLAQQQFATIGGTGTDAKFSSAFTTNPNETLSQMGNKGIIKLLKGNEDALAAKNSAWVNAQQANPNLSYRAFSQYFNSQYDPRVFQFKYMSKPERNEYVSKMDPQDAKRLAHDIQAARNQGWVNY